MIIQPVKDCTCTACGELAKSTPMKRTAAAFGYVVAGLLSVGVLVVVLLAFGLLVESLWSLL